MGKNQARYFLKSFREAAYLNKALKWTGDSGALIELLPPRRSVPPYIHTGWFDERFSGKSFLLTATRIFDIHKSYYPRSM